MNISGFELGTCHRKISAYPCDPIFGSDHCAGCHVFIEKTKEKVALVARNKAWWEHILSVANEESRLTISKGDNKGNFMRIEIFEIPDDEGGGFCAQDMDTLYRGDGETALDAVKDLLDLQVEMNRQENCRLTNVEADNGNTVAG